MVSVSSCNSPTCLSNKVSFFSQGECLDLSSCSDRTYIAICNEDLSIVSRFNDYYERQGFFGRSLPLDRYGIQFSVRWIKKSPDEVRADIQTVEELSFVRDFFKFSNSEEIRTVYSSVEGDMDCMYSVTVPYSIQVLYPENALLKLGKK